jgi:hypothetical protein
MTPLILLTVTLAILQGLDYFTTTTILGNGGKELNPVMVKLFDLLGMKPALVIKGIVVTGLGYYAGSQEILVLGGIVAVYVGIIVHNWKSMP